MNYTSTLLPQTNDPQEIQKAILDLLQKINEVAQNTSGNNSSLTSSNIYGDIVHQVPNGGEPGQYYYMGHLYLNKTNPYICLLNINPVTNNAWFTVKPQLGGNTNIKGVRILTQISFNPGVDTNDLEVACYVRPLGSNWPLSFPSFAPVAWSSITFASNVIDSLGQSLVSIFDVPLGDHDSIEIEPHFNPIGGTMSGLIVQQLGVWA